MPETIYPPFSVLLVDDEPAWLRSLGISLERSAGITNILQCQDSRQVMDLLSAPRTSAWCSSTSPCPISRGRLCWP